MRRADLWTSLDDGKIACELCAHGCVIVPGKRGLCMVRENVDGVLFSLVWGRPIASNVDPIEKKPLYHFLPGSLSYSIATVGCNFRCAFCQNWQISQQPREAGLSDHGPGGLVPPEAIVAQAQAADCASISYTYTEPTIYFEYARDCMELAVAAGLKNVFVTNGYQSAQCVAACQGLLHAANVDLKAFSDAFYRQECHARLQPVLDTLRRLHAAGVWLEVTTLLIPGKNDDPGELAELCAFIAGELSPDVPWHVSAYSPRYKYGSHGPGPTPPSALDAALAIGRAAGLRYVYAGNVPGHASETTLCPSCGHRLVGRRGYMVDADRITDGVCPGCGAAIAGVWA